jgi:hypothetical protein
MPLVGSSKIIISESAVNHLPIATFCWLPPERLLTRCFVEGVLIERSLTCFWAAN